MDTGELKYLYFVLKKIDDDRPSFITSLGFRVVLWIVLALSFLLLNSYSQRDAVNEWITAGIALFLGILVGVSSTIRVSEKSWKYVKPHISKKSIETRINEIHT